MSRPLLEFSDAITQALGPLTGLRALDIGCGAGSKTRALARFGAEMTGLEPRAEAVFEARAQGGAIYHIGGVENAPDSLGGFDLVIFTMSLHHIPDPAAALAFARRAAVSNARIAVLEPEAHDPSWPLVRLIDDEEAVYAAAQAAIDAAVADGWLTREATLRYMEREAVTDAASYLAEMVALDPARASAKARMAEIEAAFEVVVVRDPAGAYLPCWLRLDVLRRV